MKKFLAWFFAVIAFAVNTVVLLAFLNAKFDFLPGPIDSKLDCVYARLSGEKEIGNADNTENTDTYTEENNMIRLSTLIASPALEKLDLFVPNNAYIPTSEEIEGLYTVTEGAAIAALRNADQTYTHIIVNDHVVTVETPEVLMSVRDQVATQLQASCPDAIVERDHCIEWEDGSTTPVIEMFMEYDDISAYSCIAFFEAQESLVTVTINHYGGSDLEVCDSAFDMFSQTLSNVIYF